MRHEGPEGERVCPRDGAALGEIGLEISEQMDIFPQQVRVIQHQRVKNASPCFDGGLKLAPRLPQVIPKGLLSEAAQAWVITAQYVDGLPLYRQAAMLGRFGGTDGSRNTLAAGVVKVGQAAQPVVNLLRNELLTSPIVYGDETELQVFKEPGRNALTKSYLWAQMTEACGKDGRGPPTGLFGCSPSRSAETARTLYPGMRRGGMLKSDGYKPYEAIAQEHGLVHLGCWAHARRCFHEALQALPKEKHGPEQLPARFIELIGKLYHVNHELAAACRRSLAQDTAKVSVLPARKRKAALMTQQDQGQGSIGADAGTDRNSPRLRPGLTTNLGALRTNRPHPQLRDSLRL